MKPYYSIRTEPYWSATLGVDVVELQHEVSHKVTTRPYCIDFLGALPHIKTGIAHKFVPSYNST
ncbi:MAG: hypothetical protein GY820_27505 [Gammaproteobacteria bacterium]|nr:hypothetical protein [Gammaproteobacteria bacterium]